MTAQADEIWADVFVTFDPAARARWEANVTALVASPDFEWRRGMIDTDGAVCVDVENGKPTAWWCEACGGDLPEEDLPSDEPTLLDIEHTGNHGHMLALVRKAYDHGPTRDVNIERIDDGRYCLAVLVCNRGIWRYDDTVHESWDGLRRTRPTVADLARDTYGQALAAALVAAPQKTAVR